MRNGRGFINVVKVCTIAEPGFDSRVQICPEARPLCCGMRKAKICSMFTKLNIATWRRVDELRTRSTILKLENRRRYQLPAPAA
jgi:hypothetical protein